MQKRFFTTLPTRSRSAYQDFFHCSYGWYFVCAVPNRLILELMQAANMIKALFRIRIRITVSLFEILRIKIDLRLLCLRAFATTTFNNFIILKFINSHQNSLHNPNEIRTFRQNEIVYRSLV